MTTPWVSTLACGTLCRLNSDLVIHLYETGSQAKQITIFLLIFSLKSTILGFMYTCLHSPWLREKRKMRKIMLLRFPLAGRPKCSYPECYSIAFRKGRLKQIFLQLRVNKPNVLSFVRHANWFAHPHYVVWFCIGFLIGF